MTRRVRCAECNGTVPRRELARLAERLRPAGVGEERVLCDSCAGRLLRQLGGETAVVAEDCKRDHEAEREEAAALVSAGERNLADVRGRCGVAIADAEGWLRECRRRLTIANKRLDAAER